MKYMVCNCNSYGNIDYGIPILFKSNDYRTSNSIGLRYIPLPEQEFYREKTPVSKNAGNPLLEITDETFKSQYARNHDRKYIKWDSDGKPNFPLRVPKTQYMRTVKEKMFKNPPAPRNFTLLESKEEYCLKPASIPDTFYNIEAESTCRISSMGRGEQPRIKLEDKGVMKRSDSYVSTSQMSYIPFTKDQISAAKYGIITIYNAKNSEELNRIKIRKPINDAIKFKKVIKDRIVLPIVYRVPFSGKTSEYQGNYVSPTKSCLYTKTLDLGVEFDESLSKASQWQTLAAPNMYCTEYCHTGTGRSVKAAVNLKEEKKEIKHDGCI